MNGPVLSKFYKRTKEIINLENQTKIKPETREKLLTRVNIILTSPPSQNGYHQDLVQLLEELNIKQSDFFLICLTYLQKLNKKKEDYLVIAGYLFLMKKFITLAGSADESHLNGNITTIAKHLNYEKYEKNKVLMRLGEKGKKAYIILDGCVDIMIKTAREVLVSKNNYFFYLATLIRYKEYGLLNLVLNENYKTTQYEIVDDINEGTAMWSIALINKKITVTNKNSKKKFNASDLLQEFYPDIGNKDKKKERDILNYASTDEYISRIEVIKDLTDKKDKFSVETLDAFEAIVFSYKKVISLTTGALFGEIALSDPLAQRTASIVTTTESHFGTLNKVTYNASLKLSAEKQLRNALSFIHSIHLFADISTKKLNKKYFNNFSKRVVSKGEIILSENTTPDCLYLLYQGEYEMTMKASLRELTQLMKLYYSKIRNYGKFLERLEQLDRNIERESKNNSNLFKEYTTRRLLKITSVRCPEIIGLPGLFNQKGEIPFTFECKSPRGEIYELSKIFYDEMRSKERSIRENEVEFVEKRYKLITERMNGIRSSHLRSFFDFHKIDVDFGAMIEGEFQKTIGQKRKKTAKKILLNTERLKVDEENAYNKCENRLTEVANYGNFNKPWNGSPYGGSTPRRSQVIAPSSSKRGSSTFFTTMTIPRLQTEPFRSSRKLVQIGNDSSSTFKRTSRKIKTFIYDSNRNEKKKTGQKIRGFSSIARTKEKAKTYRGTIKAPSLMNCLDSNKKLFYLNDLALEKLDMKRRYEVLNQLSGRSTRPASRPLMRPSTSRNMPGSAISTQANMSNYGSMFKSKGSERKGSIGDAQVREFLIEESERRKSVV